MKEARLHFFSNHSCDWVHDGTNDLSDIFKEVAESTGLLEEAVYKIQLSWTGSEELKQANYALWSLPKGLRFLRAVPTTESPKVMGLMGIHDPDALWHYAGYTYCPWCGKEGQNEGTVVNHLRTTHFRLGLVCDLVFWLPNSDVRLTLLAWVPKLSMVLCPFLIGSVQLTHMPNQGFIQGSEGGAIQSDPLPSKRPGDLMKKALLTSLPNPSFILQPC